MIHDPSVSATQLAGPLWSSGDWHLDFRYRLILNAIAPEAMEAKGRDRLKVVGPSRHAEDALEGLLTAPGSSAFPTMVRSCLSPHDPQIGSEAREVERPVPLPLPARRARPTPANG